MSEKKKILFIINPISGVGKKNSIPPLIEKYLDHQQFDFSILYTQHRKHGHEIALAEKKSNDIIVAVGGDGSVNEIGSALVNSNCALAIIPCGSGNGLARHAKIPLKHAEAIKHINLAKLRDKPQRIDTGKVNGLSFLGTCGFGFDGHIAKKFDEYHKRGFFSYIKLVLKEYKTYQPFTFKINYQNNSFEKSALLCSIANSSQFGNGFTISPLSDLQDGKFELIFLTKLKWNNLPGVVRRFFNKRIHKSRHFESMIFDNEINIELKNGSSTFFHLDGEPLDKASRFHIEILPASLILI